MSYLVLSAVTAAIEVFVLRRLRFGWFVVALVLAGLLVEVDYLGYTPVSMRGYDTLSHIYYVDYVAEHLRVPPLDILCTTCGHPPLYYAVAALWSKVVAGAWIPRELGLQWLSLLLSFGFVVFALLLLRSFIERPATFRLAAALVVFWPSGILNSVRVHNDALASVAMLAALYFIAVWDRHGRRRDFYGALTACVLALLTKSTGYAVAATLLLVAMLRLRPAELRRQRMGQAALVLLVLVGAALLPMALRGPTSSPSLCKRVLGGACYVPPEAFVTNRPVNYLYFDLPGFLRDTSSLHYPPAQDYFWNGVVKSSLFGVMRLGEDFDGGRHRVLAALLSVLLLATLAVCVVALLSSRTFDWQRHRVLIIASASMLVLLVAFRAVIPTPFHEDFRHIFPALVPFCLFYGKSVERLGRRSGVLYKSGVGLGLLMVVSSVAFFLRVP
jgi:hypothetical protein